MTETLPRPRWRIPKQARSRDRFDRILDTAAELFADRGFDSVTADEIAAQADTSVGGLYRFFPDKLAVFEALVGFAQGLAQVQADWVLLLACDLPRLQADVIQAWRVHLPDDPAIAAVLHHSEKGWEPLCGFYRRSCLPALEKYVAEGGRSFQGWLTTQTVLALPLAASGMLFNCNTPEDLVQP